MDDDLKKLIESTAAETRQQFEKQFEKINQRFDGVDKRLDGVENAVVESRRQFEVIAESLDTKIDMVREVLSGRIDSVDAKVDALAETMAAEFRDTRAAIKFSHHDLDRRVRTLEENVTDLQSRVGRLESSAH